MISLTHAMLLHNLKKLKKFFIKKYFQISLNYVTQSQIMISLTHTMLSHNLRKLKKSLLRNIFKFL